MLEHERRADYPVIGERVARIEEVVLHIRQHITELTHGARDRDAEVTRRLAENRAAAAAEHAELRADFAPVIRIVLDAEAVRLAREARRNRWRPVAIAIFSAASAAAVAVAGWFVARGH